MKLSEVLSHPSKWCKGDIFQHADGTTASGYSPEGRCCLYGATFAVHPDDERARDALHDELVQTLNLAGLPHPGPIHFNDDPNTTFEQVQHLIRETERRLA